MIIEEDDITQRPEKNTKDVVHHLVKAGISGVPYIGGSASEIFTAIIGPTIEKRRDEWIESIAERLVDLEKEVEELDISKLSENEAFITIVLQASQAAMRTHQEEKLEALRNAIFNSTSTNSPDEDLQLMFLNYIDSFTSWHLKLLYFCYNPQNWVKVQKIKEPNWNETSDDQVIVHCFPELEGKKDFYRNVLSDLIRRDLLNYSVVGMHKPSFTIEENFRKSTNLGKQFIEYVKDPSIK